MEGFGKFVKNHKLGGGGVIINWGGWKVWKERIRAILEKTIQKFLKSLFKYQDKAKYCSLTHYPERNMCGTRF